MRQGAFGPIVRTAQEVQKEILATSGLGLAEVMAVDFDECPGALPPTAPWICDIREIRTFEMVGQVEADTKDLLLGILNDAGVKIPGRLP